MRKIAQAIARSTKSTPDRSSTTVRVPEAASAQGPRHSWRAAVDRSSPGDLDDRRARHAAPSVERHRTMSVPGRLAMTQRRSSHRPAKRSPRPSLLAGGRARATSRCCGPRPARVRRGPLRSASPRLPPARRRGLLHGVRGRSPTRRVRTSSLAGRATPTSASQERSATRNAGAHRGDPGSCTRTSRSPPCTGEGPGDPMANQDAPHAIRSSRSLPANLAATMRSEARRKALAYSTVGSAWRMTCVTRGERAKPGRGRPYVFAIAAIGVALASPGR